MRPIATIVSTLLFATGMVSTALADNPTVTINVPVNFTNIPTNLIGTMAVQCYIFPQSVTLAPNTTWGTSPNAIPIGIGMSQLVALTSANYSGTFSVAMPYLTQSLVGVTKPLPYLCSVYLWAKGATPSPDANEMQPAQLAPLLVQNPNTALVITGLVPLTSSGPALINPTIRITPPH